MQVQLERTPLQLPLHLERALQCAPRSGPPHGEASRDEHEQQERGRRAADHVARPCAEKPEAVKLLDGAEEAAPVGSHAHDGGIAWIDEYVVTVVEAHHDRGARRGRDLDLLDRLPRVRRDGARDRRVERRARIARPGL